MKKILLCLTVAMAAAAREPGLKCERITSRTVCENMYYYECELVNIETGETSTDWFDEYDVCGLNNGIDALNEFDWAGDYFGLAAQNTDRKSRHGFHAFYSLAGQKMLTRATVTASMRVRMRVAATPTPTPTPRTLTRSLLSTPS